VFVALDSFLASLFEEIPVAMQSYLFIFIFIFIFAILFYENVSKRGKKGWK